MKYNDIPCLHIVYRTIILFFVQNYTVLHTIQSQLFYTVKPPLSKRSKIGFQDQLSLNAGQKHCRMLQGEHSAILSTFIKLPFVIKIFVLSIFKWPFYAGFTELTLSCTFFTWNTNPVLHTYTYGVLCAIS